MKTKGLITTIVLSFVICHSSFAQGILTPPGAPVAGMKTLAQIEPRTAISTAPFTITSSGSYYLTGNLTVITGDGIDINTSGVTLDLNGFTIASFDASATGNGILLASGVSDIKISNGHIRGGVTNNGSGVYSGVGFANGIYSFTNRPVNVLVTGITVSGCQNNGIYLSTGDSTVVESCTVRTVGSSGICASTVKQCNAVDCGGDAIGGDQISDCRGQSSGTGDGITASYTAQNSHGQSANGYGIFAGNAQNCYGSSTSTTAVFAGVAQNCSGVSITGAGLFAITAQNCYGTSTSSVGLDAAKTANACYGSSTSGTGLSAFIAESCSGSSLSVTHNLNSY